MRIQLAILALAVGLMLGGAALMLADILTPGVAIPLMAVGIALVVGAQADGRRRRPGLR